MKFKKYIYEGRREDILGKDPNQFRVPNQDEVDSDFHKRTNYKYLKWVFDQFNQNPDYSFEEISNFTERFDKLSKNLVKKDIYQYKDLNELLDILKTLIPKYIFKAGIPVCLKISHISPR